MNYTFSEPQMQGKHMRISKAADITNVLGLDTIRQLSGYLKGLKTFRGKESA